MAPWTISFETLNSIILRYGNSDPMGMLLFWGIVIVVIIVYGAIKNISREREQKILKELERNFNEKINQENSRRLQLGIVLPTCYKMTFPILNFVQQRILIRAGYTDETDKASTIGKSEKILNSLLVHYFGSNKIFWNTREINYKRPDFIYEDMAKNIHIAIEIDEPYIFKTNKPIHYYENEDDSEKEIIYRKGGWTLIRFSEFQIVQYPHECCKFIGQVIDYYNVDSNFKNSTEFSGVKSLPPDKHWNYEDALKMAQDGARKY